MSDVDATVETLEARVKQLEDTLAIAQLVATYGPAVDSGSAEATAALWTKDGVYDVGHRSMENSEEIADMVRGEYHQNFIHSGAAHILGVPLVTIDGDTAVATCYSNIYRYLDDHFQVWRTAVNRWDLERTPDGWRANRRTTRLLDGSDDAHELLRQAIGEA